PSRAMPRWPKNPERDRLLKQLERERERLDEAAFHATIAARWREARLELGLSQSQLAKALGYGQSWCADVEAGRVLPGHRVLVLLARVSGRSVGWLLGERE